MKTLSEVLAQTEVLVKSYSLADYFYSEENEPKENMEKAMNEIKSFLTSSLREVLEGIVPEEEELLVYGDKQTWGDTEYNTNAVRYGINEARTQTLENIKKVLDN